MYSQPVRPASRRRFESLVDCFARLLETTPYPELTVRQVCAAAGISRTVFYRYFESKEDLADALIDRLVLELLAADGALPDLLAPRLDTLGWFRFWQPRAALLSTLHRSGLDGRLTDALLDLVQQTQLDPLARRLAGARYRTLCVQVRTAVCLMLSMVSEWARSGQQTPVADIARFCSAFLQQPLLGG